MVLKQLRRYRFDEVYNSGLGVVEDPDGAYVRYEDVEKLLKVEKSEEGGSDVGNLA